MIVGAFAFASAAPGGQASGAGTISGRITLTARGRGTPLPSNAYQPRTINRTDTGADIYFLIHRFIDE